MSTAELARIGAQLKATSPADTIAWAFGVGDRVLASDDESGGRYFDLASLTKPLFTAPTVLLQLQDPAELDGLAEARLGYLAALPRTPTLRELLSHRSGLPDELPVGMDAVAVRGWYDEQLARDAADRRVVYSDPGYWLLGRWAESVAGIPLHRLYEQAPAASAGGFRFGGAPAAESVPAGPVADGRQLTHDPASRSLGESGHAGAFGTLPGVIAAIGTWLRPAWIDATLADEAFGCQTHPVPGGHRTLAWTLSGDPYHAVAHDWPTTTVCHSGFTGVSVALDPVSGWWAVYLSNAIPVDRDATPILIARRLFHAEAARRLRAATAPPEE